MTTTFATVQSIINDSAMALGQYDPGEVMDSTVSTVCLRRFNDMLDGMSIQSQACFNFTQSNLLLTNGQATYTIGPTGDIVVENPVELNDAWIQINNIRYEIDFIGPIEYSQIINATIQGIPDRLYYNNGMPNSTIKLFPVPLSSQTLYIDALTQLPEYSSLSTTLAMPPGYQEMFVYNLACRLAPFFGIDPPPIVVATARESLGNIKRMYNQKYKMRTDIPIRGTGYWNVYSGY